MSYVIGDVDPLALLQMGLDAGTGVAKDLMSKVPGTGGQQQQQQPQPSPTPTTTKSAMPAWALPAIGIAAVGVVAVVLNAKKKKKA